MDSVHKENDLPTRLLKAVIDHDIEQVANLIQENVDLNCQYCTDQNPLLHEAIAALSGNETNENSILIIFLLIENGAQINATNLYGQTALHVATLLENSVAVRILLTYGANPNIEDSNKDSAKTEATRIDNKTISSLFDQFDLETQSVTRTNAEELHLVDMPKDGNCLFHAVARQLSIRGYGYTHEELRGLAITYIVNHLDDFQDFIEHISLDQYIDEMLEIGSWADHTIIRALSLALEININIYRPGEAPTAISPEFGAIINIAYTNGNHYQSIESTMNTSITNPSLNTFRNDTNFLENFSTEVSEEFNNSLDQSNNLLTTSVLAILMCCFEGTW